MTSWTGSTGSREGTSRACIRTLKCDLCGRPSISKELPTGRPLCEKHFLKSIWKRASEEIKGIKGPILLSVSGGKDSLVLMDVMSNIYDPSELVALTVVEGAEGYEREEERRNACLLAKKLGIEYNYVTFKDLYGKKLSEMVKVGKQRPCTYCGVFRRRAVEMVALKLGIRNVATGHTLDDEVHTSFLNLLRGDWDGIAKLAHGRLKPLRRVFEKEVAVYAYIRKFPLQKKECPYLDLNPSLRSRVRVKLFDLVEENPSKLYKWSMKMKELRRESEERGTCERCGFPTSPGRRICRACELAEEVGAKVPTIDEAEKITLRSC
ncbi:potassium-transporting ATPase subunit A [Ignicoccus pacificus DSM 13166]|uniref:Potassium-transporting ATPase subunit A n=1 Tax=Ignicoccus pacificus DSM 13166 TaxID=940294 RepID=A0A977K9A2_9CREN|nr:potassium-transporting ATPase subunit A [Ignicoccus pacificus DSM 13166]